MSGTMSFALTPVSANTPSGEDDQYPDQGPYGHGSFQRRTLFFCIIALVVVLCHSHVFALISRPVDHWCKPPAGFANLTDQDWKNVGIPLDQEGRYSNCFAYARPGAVNDTVPELIPCEAWDYDQERADETARTFWNMVCHRRWFLVLGNAVHMSGALFLVPVAGYMADTAGRRPVIIGAVLLLLFGTFESCRENSYPVYLAMRFMNSGCASSVFLVTLNLLYEVTPLEHRVLYMSLGASVGVFLTDVFFLLLAELRLHWSPLQAAIVSPTVLLVSALCIILESPLWLLTQSWSRQAEDVMMRVAKINGVPIERALESLRKLQAQLNKWTEYHQKRISPLNVLCVVGNRAAVVFFVSFAITLAFYTISWTRIQQDKPVVKITTVCLSLPCYTAMYLALNKMGRKQFLVFMLPLLGGVCCLCSIAVYMPTPQLADALVIVAKECASVLVPANYIYIAELFPTGGRCAVMCAAYACGRVGAVVASALRLLREYQREDLGYAIVGVAVFSSLVLFVRMPETSYGRNARPPIEHNRDLLTLMHQSEPGGEVTPLAAYVRTRPHREAINRP